MKEICKEIKRFFLILVILVASGYFLLVAVYALPTDKMYDNVQQSLVVFETECSNGATYWHMIPGIVYTRLDDYTDALMLLNAENERSGSAWEEALEVNRLSAKGLNPAHTLVSLHSGQAADYNNTSYGRYWHGYLIYLKPLLMLFDYKQIRFILMLAQTSLVFALLYLLGKKNKKECFLPVLTSVCFLNPAVCAMSLQYTPVFVLTMAQMILILLFEEKYRTSRKLWLYHFFIVGCLTAYFDLLTYPLVTFGIPIAFMLSQFTDDFKVEFKMLIGTGLLWVLGYGIMWASKWILGTLITGNNFFTSAASAIATRTGIRETTDKLNIINAIKLNCQSYNTYTKMVIVLFAVCIIVGLLRKNKPSLEMLPLLCIAAMPLLWYAVLSNHSKIHFWMTYREMAISVYAVMTVGMMFINKTKKLN